MARHASTEPPSDLHATAASRLRALGHTYPTRRRELVDILAAAPQPVSIPDVLDQDRGLAQSSVYRNLAILELAGIVHRIVTKDEFARFELSEELSGHHHHHLICSSCGAVEDVTSGIGRDECDPELNKLAASRGFAASSHHGSRRLCAVCQRGTPHRVGA